MSDESLDFVKDEIKFFMEKSFQLSFGYAGGLVAVVALANAEVARSLTSVLATSSTLLFASAILFLNATYLMLGTACLFALLKRGYFILLHSQRAPSGTNVLRQWEVFVRTDHGQMLPQRLLNQLAWNVDNYYMIPLYVFIAVSSVAALVLGLRAATRLYEDVVIWALFSAHAIPSIMIVSTARLNVLCRQTLKDRKEAMTCDEE